MVELALPARASPLFLRRGSCDWIPEGTNPTTGFHLFFLSRPTAVAWFVVSIVVDAVKLVFRTWASSHVGEKILVRHPAFANGNTAPSPVFEVFAVFVEASLFHIRPSQPFRRSMSLSMRARSLRGGFFLKASTRTSAARTQIMAQSGRLLAAITKTVPRLALGIVGKRDQLAEALIRDVDELWHARAYHETTIKYITD